MGEIRDDGDVSPDGPMESWLVVPRRDAMVGTDAAEACDVMVEGGAEACAADAATAAWA